jgi:hypothetical protein
MSENKLNKNSSIDRVISKTKYNRGEHKKFYLFHLFHRTQTLYFMFALIIFLLVLTIVNVAKQQNVVFSCIMFGVTCAMVPILIISKINQVVKQETPERVKSTDTIEVTKSKITRSNDVTSGKAVVGWNNIDCVCENDKFIYIYLTDQSGLFIKKEDIVEGDVETFRKLAINNMKVDKRGRILYKRYQSVGKAYRLEQNELKKQKRKEAKAQKALEKKKEKK